LDLQDNFLILTDPIDDKMLNKQSINSIRVWGVGRDNGRDFAYVAKDKQTKIHMCHVFRCDSASAKDVANALRDTCKRILHEKNEQAAKAAATSNTKSSSSMLPKRPNFLTNFANTFNNPANENSVSINLKSKSISFSSNEPSSSTSTNRCCSLSSTESSSDLASNISEDVAVNSSTNSLLAANAFLAPMEEPKKTIRCVYLGSKLVGRPTGITVLNEAIEKIYQKAVDEYKEAKKAKQLLRKRRSIMKNAAGSLSEETADQLMDVRIDDEDVDDYECEPEDEDDENNDDDEFSNANKSITFDNLLDIQTERRLGVEVDVVVSPSTVSINKVSDRPRGSRLFRDDDDDEDNVLVECRVRYLCFMGISADIR
jgi:hypothetical protein